MESTITRYFPAKIAAALAEVKYGGINEIRLRCSRPPALTSRDGILYLMPNGGVSSDSSKAVIATAEDVRKTFDAVCQYSLHSWHNQIAQCFVTVTGGHRAGICGTAVFSAGGRTPESLRDISGINFRIAREVTGCADSIVSDVFGGRLRSILLCGRPASGKTTVLRDLCRQLGARYPVSLIDERCEIAACSRGVPQNDVGMNTDVFSCFSKSDGIITALRVMSPRMIMCDEIGGEDDTGALLSAANSGVYIAATVHCNSPDDIYRKPNIRKLIENGVFDCFVFIKNGKAEKVSEIRRRV